MGKRRREPCKFEHCENDATYPVLGVCSACYSRLRTWVSRSPAARRARMGQYQRMQESMEYLMAGKGLLPGYSKKRKRSNT